MSLNILFYFISFAQKKNLKKTKEQTERTLAGTPQQLWPITAGPDTNKKIETFYTIVNSFQSLKQGVAYKRVLRLAISARAFSVHSQGFLDVNLKHYLILYAKRNAPGI